jgi:hypothetical protein
MQIIMFIHMCTENTHFAPSQNSIQVWSLNSCSVDSYCLTRIRIRIRIRILTRQHRKGFSASSSGAVGASHLSAASHTSGGSASAASTVETGTPFLWGLRAGLG